MHLLVVKVQTRDYKQDYVLTHHCKDEIKECTKDGKDDEKHVIGCLKEKLFAGKLKNDPECQADVFRLITENRVDIFTDKELYGACQHDLRESYCKDIPAGSGRDSRWYFLSVIGVVLIIILGLGVMCGRVTKRVAAEVKNR
ncbi:GLG1 [Bugula neritina]|uniref:GLG1 n=1 Tax=Bugula neritina TaxID=10212 RepID=A0A7J7J3V0_BUGNE|nr:GLG1 [Bugula neritina]